MGIFFACIAALFASISNLCMRKGIDHGGSSRAYLLVQLTFSFLVMILLNPVRTGDYAWNWNAVLLGLVGGILLGLLMWGIGKTVERGPPGLSFAVLNASTVMPAVVMVLLFGPLFGHTYTAWNGIGSILVLVGLFWAGWTSAENKDKAIWALFATFIFVIHTFFLVYLQWWAMVIRPDVPSTPLIPFHIDPATVAWFMPAMTFAAALIQWCIYFMKENRLPKGAEVLYGILGGVTNGACTFFLILAPQVAKPFENAMLFPIFSVAIIIICNVWARVLYKEEVNWKANVVCLAGLLIGTVSWNALFS